MDKHVVGFGIIGAGTIAGFHARAIAAVEGAELRAVCSRTVESAARFCAEHGGAAESDLSALLARDDIDVVCITVPSGSHGEIAIRALESGRHVLCEKPLEITTARIDAMIATANRTGRILAGVFQSRLGEDAKRLKRAIEEGKFGRLALCSAYVKWWRDPEYYTKSSWKGTAELDGGGALMNQAIHAIDLLQWLAGVPVRVSARIATRIHAIEVEDTAAAWLEFADGSLGVIEAATSCHPGTDMRIEIAGEKGTAMLENGRLTRSSFTDGASLAPFDTGRGTGSGANDPKSIGIEGHRKQIEDLIGAIRNGGKPSISAEEARRAVAIIEAIYRSHRSALPVELSAR